MSLEFEPIRRRGAVLAGLRATAALALLAACQVHARVLPPPTRLVLSGVVADAQRSSSVQGGTLYQTWTLQLTGLDDSNAFTAYVGSFIDASVSLDRRFTVPASSVLSDVELSFSGSGFPSGDTVTRGTTTFVLGGTADPAISAGSFGTTASGQLANGVSFGAGSSGPLGFDSLVSQMSVIRLTAPGTLNSASISFRLASPVPESPTLATFVAGLAAMAFLMRMRRRSNAG